MSVTFRKYHRLIAIIVCLPLIVTAVTGIAMTLTDEWFHQNDLTGLLLKVHTGASFSTFSNFACV